VAEVEALESIEGGFGADEAGSLPPKEKPTPSGVTFPFVMDCERGNWILELALGILVTGASTSFFRSTSCEPSSAIVEVGREPGRGKNIDRFRE
jgi:hypothetical protein